MPTTTYDISKSYLVPFDPDNTGEPFGFMRANINGRDQWWLVQVWAEDDPDETVMVRFLEQDGPGTEFEDMAEGFKGRPWYPKQVIAGRMSQQEADRRIDMMEAIVSRLTRTAQAE